MTEKPHRTTTRRVIATLRELVSALDRRVPHGERPSELRIARDALMLRREAMAQIEQLTRQEPDDEPYDQDLVGAMMTDDGGPAPESETNTRSSRII